MISIDALARRKTSIPLLRSTFFAAERRPLLVAWVSVLAAAIWMAAKTPIVSQEAYYWSYAQRLAMSYYDHPPMVAWLIAAGTSMLGDGPLGLRIMTLACAVGTTCIGVLSLKRCGGALHTSVAWVVLSLGVPMFAAGHVLATPDAPLTFFSTASMFALWRARETGKTRCWLAAGLGAGCALLSKYTAVFLAVGGVLVLLGDARMRAHLLRPGPWLAFVAALCCFLPVLIWNAQHDWASFRFQTESRYRNAALNPMHMIRFVLIQAVMFSPMLAVLLPKALVWLAGRCVARDARALWLLAFGLPLPVFMCVNSFWMQIKPNWLVATFVPLVIAILWWAQDTRLEVRSPRLARVLAAGVLMTIVVGLGAPMLDRLPQHKGASWSGWTEIARRAEYWEEVVDAEDSVEGNVFFFGADYKDSSQLHRNLRLSVPRYNADEPVMSHNVVGLPALQFDYWESPGRHIGEDAILVLTRPNNRPDELMRARRHFDRLEEIERISVRRAGRVVLEAGIYVGRNYRGPEL